MIPDDWLQELLILETNFAYFVQQRFSYFERFFSVVSAVSDPNNAVLHLYPCIAVLCGPFSRLSVNLMWVGSLINWTSTELKWLLRGDRPFWWVKEVTQTYAGLPPLRQTRDTCVANPGNPSDHVMLSAGIMIVVFNAILSLNEISCRSLSKSSNSISAAWYSCRGKLGLWTLYIIMLIIVMLSRIYNATHFPHQCILGAVLGGVVANSISANWSSDWLKRQQSFKILFYAAIPLFLAFVSYWLQKAFGIDPQLSVRLAFKWCFSPMDINVNTTSIYMLTNSCGSLLGIAFASIFQRLTDNYIPSQTLEKNISGNEFNLYSFLKEKIKFLHLANGVVVLSSSYLLIELRKHIPTDNVIMFYLYHFFINVAATFLFLGVVPIFLVILFRMVKVKQN